MHEEFNKEWITKKENEGWIKSNQTGFDNGWYFYFHQAKLGWLGKFFGAAENAAVSISGLIIIGILIFLILSGFVGILCDGKIEKVEKFWNLSIPIITLSLGYIFGKKGE